MLSYTTLLTYLKLLLGAALLMALPSTTLAGDDVPAPLQAALQLKILSFDRSLVDSEHDQIIIAALYLEGAPQSKLESEQIAKSLNLLSSERNLKVHGKTVKAILIPYETEDSLAQIGHGADAIYVASALHDELPAICAFTTEHHLPSFVSKKKMAKDCASVAVIAAGGKPKIVVNIESAKSVNMQLDPRLLSLAEIIK